MSENANLHKARSAKQDEFYTQLVDIEKELKHYKRHFKGKTVLCNCDDPKSSNFWLYFIQNFEHLGLKKLITTHYEEDKPSYKLEITGDTNDDGKVNKDDGAPELLKQNGDFRSPECIELLKQSDIVVTNPPFSLFREYVAQLVEYKKKFLIIGSLNAVTYKEIFPLIQDEKLWLGPSIHSGDMSFKVPDNYEPRATRFWVDEDGQKWRSIGNGAWFTNLDFAKRNEELILFREYNPKDYPKYDNYDAINVDKVKDIPVDYFGEMGVPITFLDKHNPKQFEILSCNDFRRNEDTPIKKHGLIKDKDGTIDGKPKYVRIIIRRKK